MSDVLKLPEFVKYVILKDSPEIRRVVSYDRFFEGKGAYMVQVPSGKNDGTMIIDKYTESQVEHKFYSKDEVETYKQEKEQPMSTPEERRDNRFFEATKTALKNIQELSQLSQPERYFTAYSILRGYVEVLLVNFAEAFSGEQLAEIRIVLDQLSQLTSNDENLDEATRAKQDQLAQALRETEDTP